MDERPDRRAGQPRRAARPRRPVRPPLQRPVRRPGHLTRPPAGRGRKHRIRCRVCETARDVFRSAVGPVGVGEAGAGTADAPPRCRPRGFPRRRAARWDSHSVRQPASSLATRLKLSSTSSKTPPSTKARPTPAHRRTTVRRRAGGASHARRVARGRTAASRLDRDRAVDPVTPAVGVERRRGDGQRAALAAALASRLAARPIGSMLRWSRSPSSAPLSNSTR